MENPIRSKSPKQPSRSIPDAEFISERTMAFQGDLHPQRLSYSHGASRKHPTYGETSHLWRMFAQPSTTLSLPFLFRELPVSGLSDDGS